MQLLVCACGGGSNAAPAASPRTRAAVVWDDVDVCVDVKHL